MFRDGRVEINSKSDPSILVPLMSRRESRSFPLIARAVADPESVSHNEIDSTFSALWMHFDMEQSDIDTPSRIISNRFSEPADSRMESSLNPVPHMSSVPKDSGRLSMVEVVLDALITRDLRCASERLLPNSIKGADIDNET